MYKRLNWFMLNSQCKHLIILILSTNLIQLFNFSKDWIQSFHVHLQTWIQFCHVFLASKTSIYFYHVYWLNSIILSIAYRLSSIFSCQSADLIQLNHFSKNLNSIINYFISIYRCNSIISCLSTDVIQLFHVYLKM